MRTLEAGVINEMGLLPKKPPPEPDDVGRSVYMPAEQWDDLTAIAEDTKGDDPLGKGYSRNEVIKLALKKFAEDYWRDKKDKKKR